MTKEEVRQELKETEGDPQIKARIRSLQREVARRRMMAEVPKADVVVTNPTTTRSRCATREGTMRAPRVVAKGSLLVAERIVELARDNGVPILRAPPLARALFAHAEVGQEIPGRAVQRGGRGAGLGVPAAPLRGRRRRASRASRPLLPVPAELDPGPGCRGRTAER